MFYICKLHGGHKEVPGGLNAEDQEGGSQDDSADLTA